MAKNKNTVLVLVAAGVVAYFLLKKKRKGSVIVPPLDKGEFLAVESETVKNDPMVRLPIYWQQPGGVDFVKPYRTEPQNTLISGIKTI